VFVRIWRYRVRPGAEDRFEDLYSPSGDWARLFLASAGYLGTELLHGIDGPGIYVTVDRWESREAWTTFRDAYREAYESLDRRCDALTVLEESLGGYVSP
jgi:heme-degrading monooxygenase HmoA